jgi:SAM-dependent methyltransferase
LANNYLINKTISFKFRGINLSFDLSPGLFSSADIDTGTKLLLKVFSRIFDEDTASGKPLPRRVLDSGCGTGIIGICAAAALSAAVPPGDNSGFVVHCQDRDELARLVTLRNAAQNGIPPAALEAYTEPLLAGHLEMAGWDLIFTNIPAKTGTPVLEDFIRRSAGMLNPGGRVIMVAVNTLADFFRERISAEAKLEREEKGSGHTVFVYKGASHNIRFNLQKTSHKGTKAQRKIEIPFPLRASVPSCEEIGTNVCDSTEYPADFFTLYPFYIRTSVTCPIENIPIHLETIHGAGGFDSPGGAVLAAAKLAVNLLNTGRVKLQFPLLVHEPGQGFFPCWLLTFLRDNAGQAPGPLFLSGRNILALEATAHNVRHNATIIPVADLSLGGHSLLEAAGGRQYGCIIAFPEILPQSSLSKTAKGRQEMNQLDALWKSLPPLLAGGGIFLAAFGSSDAERFDRKKPAGFSRLGSIKRNGFRALAYLCTGSDDPPP